MTRLATDTFQSTLPSQGATETQRQTQPQNRHFNPRSPHRERRNRGLAFLGSVGFQSTLPSQGATDNLKLGYGGTKISIHAPLTGSDARVATEMVFSTISIHAPLTGSDVIAVNDPPADPQFQSTLPSQGAT